MPFRKPECCDSACHARMIENQRIIISQNDRIMRQNAIIMDLLVRGSVRDSEDGD